MVTGEARPTVSAGGVPEGGTTDVWFIAVVKRNSEKVVRDLLKGEGYEAYVATQTMMRRYDKRRPKEVEYVRIPAKVFIRLPELPRGPALTLFFREHPYIPRFMTDRAGSASGLLRYAQIPNREMQRMRDVLGDPDNEVLFGYPDESYAYGDTVRVVRGPLRDMEGTLVSKDGKNYFCLVITDLNCAKVQVSLTDVEPVKR